MPARTSPPCLSKQDLLSQARQRNQEIRASVGPSGNPEMDAALWDQTQKDVASGWAVISDLAAAPATGALSRRFGIQLGAKVRAIDDFSISLVNSTVGVQERIRVMTVDDSISLALAFCAQTDRPILQGRSFDLKSAYRQLPVHQDDLDVSQVAVYNPELQRACVLLMTALPFGASASVWSFIRLALALWQIGVQWLRAPWTSYYDDFNAVTLEQDCRSIQAAIFLFFQLTGWKLATEGQKAALLSGLAGPGGVHRLHEVPPGHGDS